MTLYALLHIVAQIEHDYKYNLKTRGFLGQGVIK